MSKVVERMVCDHWDGVVCSESELGAPSFEDAWYAIQSLNGAERTMVCLYAKNGNTLSVGGASGRFVVCASTPDGELLGLVGDEHCDQLDSIALNIGGQEGLYMPRQVCSGPRVESVLKAFFQSGDFDRSSSWEPEHE